MTDHKTQPDVTKVITNTGTIRIETPAGSRVRGRRRKQAVVDLVTPDEFVGGFLMFLREHAIVGLAVGFAIGAQAQGLVNALVKSFILPLVELFFGQNLSTRDFTLHFRHHGASFAWGGFAVALITFVFVLLAIYVLVKVLKLDRLDLPKDKK